MNTSRYRRDTIVLPNTKHQIPQLPAHLFSPRKRLLLLLLFTITMAALSPPTAADAATTAHTQCDNDSNAPSAKAKPETAESKANSKSQTRQKRFDANQEMVQKYHAMFPKIPTMTSEELVERWKQIDRLQDERDDSQNSDESDADDDSTEHYQQSADQPGPLLLIDVRSKAERDVSMLQGAVAMDDLETTKWINKYVHHFDGVHRGGIPTIVTYCTIGYRSGREAQWLVDDFSGTFGIDIGTSVEIKNLDGILSYSFVEDAPPLLRPCRKGSSDSFMTRTIHSYGKEWSTAADPAFEVIFFDTKKKKLQHLVQTGLISALRLVQHKLHKSTTKARETTESMAKPVVEPLANMAGASIVEKSSTKQHNFKSGKKRISATGFTANEATQDVS